MREVKKWGVFVPERDASWEQGTAFSELYDRYSQCDAMICLCLKQGGRKHVEEAGYWQLIICSLCGGHGIHSKCNRFAPVYICPDCSSSPGPSRAAISERDINEAGPSNAEPMRFAVPRPIRNQDSIVISDSSDDEDEKKEEKKDEEAPIKKRSFAVNGETKEDGQSPEIEGPPPKKRNCAVKSTTKQAVQRYEAMKRYVRLSTFNKMTKLRKSGAAR